MYYIHSIHAAANVVISAVTPVARATAAYSTAYLFNSHVYEPLANTASEYAKEWGLYEYKTAVSESIYNFTSTNLSPEVADFGSHLSKNFLPSLKDAVLLDGIVFYVLGGPILPGIIGATIAYDLRASINSYFENSKLHGVAGGFFAGAIKYGIAGLTLDKKVLLIGAMNNAAYEYFKTADDDPVTNNDVIGLYALLFQIEGTDAVLNVMLREKGILEQLTTTLKVAGLLSGSVWGFLTPGDKSFYCDTTQCYKKDLLVHNITYIDERYKGDYDFTLKRIPNHFYKMYNDTLDATTYINEKYKGDHDSTLERILNYFPKYALLITSEEEVTNMNSTLYYSTKTQCALKDFTQLNICRLDEYYDESSQNTELTSEEVSQNIKEDL
jgi:hypothetical protein